jgi:hypothetical protein
MKTKTEDKPEEQPKDILQEQLDDHVAAGEKDAARMREEAKRQQAAREKALGVSP